MKVYRIHILEKPDHFFCWHNYCGQTTWNKEKCGMTIGNGEWPSRRNYFSKSAANRMIAKLQSNGATVDLLESDDIEYHSTMEVSDPTQERVQKAHSELVEIIS